MTWVELVTGAASVGILPKRMAARARAVPKKVAKTMLSATFVAIADAVLHGRRVAVPGFGVFYQARRKARRVKCIKTGEWRDIPAQVGIGFHTSSSIRR